MPVFEPTIQAQQKGGFHFLYDEERDLIIGRTFALSDLPATAEKYMNARFEEEILCGTTTGKKSSR